MQAVVEFSFDTMLNLAPTAMLTILAATECCGHFEVRSRIKRKFGPELLPGLEPRYLLGREVNTL